MLNPSSIEARLLATLAVIAVVAVAGVLVILPYRLYERDIRQATDEAQRLSSVVHSALSCPLASGRDATDLVNRLQGTANLEIRLAKLDDPEEHPLHRSQAGSSIRSGTDLRYVAPPVLAGDGGSWLAELFFDLSSMKRDSVRLIFDLMLAIVVGAALFSAAIYWLFRRALLAPLAELSHAVEHLAAGDAAPRLPRFDTAEMQKLAASIEALARRGSQGDGI